MKNLLKILLFLFFAVSSAVHSQNYISEFDGIPLISSLPHDIGEYHYDSVKAMGTNILIMNNANSTRLGYARQRGFKVIPNQVILDQSNGLLYNYILRYTEARYSKWEAEGNPPEDGLAKLSYKSSIGEIFTEGNISGVVSKNNASADTLIRGPGYKQEIRYTTIDEGDSIIYSAEFRLKLTNNIPDALPNDTICVLQVSNSRIFGPPWYIGYNDFLRDTVLLRSDFTAGN